MAWDRGPSIMLTRKMTQEKNSAVEGGSESSLKKGTNMQSNDEQTIFNETEAFAEAWNKGDAAIKP